MKKNIHRSNTGSLFDTNVMLSVSLFKYYSLKQFTWEGKHARTHN